MKRLIVLPALLLMLLFVACHKDDWHGHKEFWQLSSDGFGARFQYKYDANRLLTNITLQPWGMGPNFSITNDAQKRPKSAKDSVDPSVYKYHYQGDRLTRIDYQNTGGVVAEQFFFSYDNKGRMTRREGDFRYFRYADYEYAGNAANFKRVSYYNNPSAKGGVAVANQPNVYVDYTYDNEHSPYSTLINTTVLPIANDVYFGYIIFQPVLPNNPTRATYYGYTDTGYQKFMEHRFFYTYENHYPVTVTDSTYSFNPDGSIGFRSGRAGVYTYDKLKR